MAALEAKPARKPANRGARPSRSTAKADACQAGAPASGRPWSPRAPSRTARTAPPWPRAAPPRHRRPRTTGAPRLAARLAAQPGTPRGHRPRPRARPAATSPSPRSTSSTPDVRSPDDLPRLVRAANPDVVVHNDNPAVRRAGSRGGAQLHDINVIGTLSAAHRVRGAAVAEHDRRPGLRRRSTARSPAAPAFFTEDMAEPLPPCARGSSATSASSRTSSRRSPRRHPEVDVHHVAHAADRRAGARLADHAPACAPPFVPTFLGYDPRVQVLDADDSVAALAAAIEHAGARPRERRRRGHRLAAADAAPDRGARRCPLAVPLFGPRRRDRVAARPARRWRRRSRATCSYGSAASDLTRMREELALPRPHSPPSRRSSALCCPRARGGGVIPGALDGDRRAGRGPARRLRGDYDEDEWGFDPGFAAAVRALAGLPLRPLVAGHPDRARALPAPGRALIVANHAGRRSVGRVDDGHRRCARGGVPPPALPRPHWAFSLPWASAAIRRFGGVPASPANALALLRGQGHARHGLPRGRQGRGQALAAGTGSSASAAAASSSSRCAPARRSCRARSWAARRSTRSSASCRCLARLPARRTSRSHRPSPCLARWAPCRYRRRCASPSTHRFDLDRLGPVRGRGPCTRPRAVRPRPRADPAEGVREPDPTRGSVPLMSNPQFESPRGVRRGHGPDLLDDGRGPRDGPRPCATPTPPQRFEFSDMDMVVNIRAADARRGGCNLYWEWSDTMLTGSRRCG